MPTDIFYEVFKEINEKIGEQEKKHRISYIEVTEKQWKSLMTYQEFREQAEKRNANLGGYQITKGKEFKIHRFEDVFES